MRTVTKFLIVFLAITGAVALATGMLNIPFGRQDYWDHHGILFLIFVTLFPRLTLLLSSVPFGGLFWWIGWFFAPRLLVAVLGTIEYWQRNPVLVVIAWLVALGGESSEKYVVVHRSRNEATRRKEPKWVEAEVVESRSLPDKD